MTSRGRKRFCISVSKPVEKHAHTKQRQNRNQKSPPFGGNFKRREDAACTHLLRDPFGNQRGNVDDAEHSDGDQAEERGREQVSEEDASLGHSGWQGEEKRVSGKGLQILGHTVFEWGS